MISFQEFTTPIKGKDISSSISPTAFNKDLWGARSSPFLILSLLMIPFVDDLKYFKYTDNQKYRELKKEIRQKYCRIHALHFYRNHQKIWSIIEPLFLLLFLVCATATLIFSSTEEALFLIGLLSAFGPMICAEWIPVMIAMQRTLPSYSFFTLAPHITFAWESSSYVRDEAICSASWRDISVPPVMWSKQPVAPFVSTSSSGWFKAALTTSFALSCPFASPTSITASPPPFIIALTSA